MGVLSTGWASPPSDPALAETLLALTNEARSANGLAKLEADTTLAQAAQQHAAEMAELGYFSHTSPVLENATLTQRVAQAGSFMQLLGENLALVGDTDPAQATVTGWLESPGHRANLLSREFSHVGFGSARYPDGRLAVAQVLAYQPAPLEAASLVSVLSEVSTLDVSLELSSAAEVAVFFGDTSSQPTPLAAGPQTLHVTLSAPPPLPLPVQLGSRSEGEGFILQDDGWLQAGGWEGSVAPTGTVGQLLDVGLSRRLERVYEMRLEFSRPPTITLAAWQGDRLIGASLSGTALTLRLPQPESLLPLQLGAAQDDGRYQTFYSFTPQFDGAPKLVPTRISTQIPTQIPTEPQHKDDAP